MAGSHRLVPNLAVEAPLVSGQTCARARFGGGLGSLNRELPEDETQSGQQ